VCECRISEKQEDYITLIFREGVINQLTLVNLESCESSVTLIIRTVTDIITKYPLIIRTPGKVIIFLVYETLE